MAIPESEKNKCLKRISFRRCREQRLERWNRFGIDGTIIAVPTG